MQVFPLVKVGLLPTDSTHISHANLFAKIPFPCEKSQKFSIYFEN